MTKWQDGKEHEDWEVEPSGDTDLDFALVAEPEWIFGSKSGPEIHLSNQTDCTEFIQLQTVEQIDDLVERLQSARQWLSARLVAK